MSTTIFLVNPVNFASGESYLVDDYSPEVAYSLRKLSSSTTNVVRLRRSSDNAESDFSETDLTDGTATTWTGISDGLIAKWYNQGTSGATYDIVQGTASNQPLLISSGVVQTRNSKPSVLFGGGSNRYIDVSSNPFNLNNVSFFAVGDQKNSSSNSQMLTLSDSVGQSLVIARDTRTTQKRNFWIRNSGGSGGTYYYADLSVARTAVDTLVLQSAFVDGSKNMSAFDNGATGGTNTYTLNYTSDAIRIGANGTGTTFHDGRICEVIGFNSDKSTDRTNIETNINDFYSIY